MRADRTVDARERTTYTYTTQPKDENGVSIAAFNALTLTLYNVRDETIINSRSQQNVLNANGGTYAAGTFTMVFDPLDMVIVDETLGDGNFEEHVALFEYTYDGTKKGYWKMLIRVQVVAKRPTP